MEGEWVSVREGGEEGHGKEHGGRGKSYLPSAEKAGASDCKVGVVCRAPVVFMAYNVNRTRKALHRNGLRARWWENAGNFRASGPAAR